MLTRNEFIQDAARVFDRVYGAMSGLAIGDSFGDASRKPENRANYSVTTDFNKGASWSTDDTEFALLTAKTIIRCGGKLTTEECVRSWMEDVVTQDEYKRGGASEIEAANNLRKGLMPPLSGKYNSFRLSDGSSMRIAPFPMTRDTLLTATPARTSRRTMSTASAWRARRAWAWSSMRPTVVPSC